MLSDLKLWQRNLIILMFLISILFLIIGGIVYLLVAISFALPLWITSVILFLSTTIIWIIFNRLNH